MPLPFPISPCNSSIVNPFRVPLSTVDPHSFYFNNPIHWKKGCVIGLVPLRSSVATQKRRPWHPWKFSSSICIAYRSSPPSRHMLKQISTVSTSKSSAIVQSRSTKTKIRGQTYQHFKSASLRQQHRTMASSSAASNDTAPASTKTFKFAAIQMRCTADKLANLENAFQLIKEASSKGAQLIALPVRIQYNHL